MPAARPPRERPSGGDPRLASQPDGGPIPRLEPEGAAAGERELPSFGSPLFGTQPAALSSAAQEYAPYPYRKKRWSWVMAAATILAAALVAGGAIAVGLRFFAVRPAAEPISLAVYERDAQLRIEWNHDAAPIHGASRGTLEIVDGPNTRSVPLTPTDLARGSFTYARTSGDVQVRLEVENANGGKTQEASRFLGTPPRAADANELDTTQLERDALKDEVTRLRNQNAAQAERVQQLERTLTILRARLGIVAPAKQ